MKRPVFLSLSIIFMTACAPSGNEEELRIATTFAPLYDFTKRIVGDKADVICLVGDNEVHGFSLSSVSDAAFLEECDLIVKFGNNIDSFVDSIEKDKQFVCSEGLEMLTDDKGNIDPHAWLSIRRARKMMSNICQEIVRIDPENEEYYMDNLQLSLDQFQQLDNKYALSLLDRRIDYVCTSHSAFSYLLADYGLTEVSISGIANNEPTSGELRSVIEEIKERDIHHILVEELDSADFANAVRTELARESYTVDLLEVNAYEGVDVSRYSSGDDYLFVMESNLEQISRSVS